MFLLQTKTNSISWNPMEPMNFTAVSATFGSLFCQKSLIHGKCCARVGFGITVMWHHFSSFCCLRFWTMFGVGQWFCCFMTLLLVVLHFAGILACKKLNGGQ